MDSRFAISLVAEAPEIVTPIGAVVDEKNRLFVIESHTHHPPREYPGPKGDRIKIFEERQSGSAMVFAEGLSAAMNLAFAPNGTLYVVCAGEVWRLEDRDGDNVAEKRTRVLELITTDQYAHSRMLGITFGPDGLLYVSRGNTGGHKYTLRGSDGSTVSGYGEGGNIVRCLPDGTRLERYATGFWNPFDLKFHSSGRLLAVDNDPDARGPNRLVHVVQDGDYGYKSLYGGAGNHPFQGWDGELPGTLPYISGTGEAPSGLVDCSKLPFPGGFGGSVLVTIWGENTIERHELTPRGISLAGKSSVFVSGEKDFRPVALAPDSKGNIYVTDWVKVDYPNHGEGRIWKMSHTGNVAVKPVNQEKFSRPLFSGEKEVRAALRSDDPFVRHAAVVSLKSEEARKLAKTEGGIVRLGALLALRKLGKTNELGEFLKDSDERVRQAAMIWAGEEMLVNMRQQLDLAIDQPQLSSRLFQIYLAAIENLDPEFVRDYHNQKSDSAKALKRQLEPGLVEGIIADSSRPEAVRAMAITHMTTQDTTSGRELLIGLARSGPEKVRLAAIEKLAQAREGDARPLLEELAQDTSNSKAVRTEAMAALAWYHIPEPQKLSGMVNDSDLGLQLQSVQTLRPYVDQPDVKETLVSLLEGGKSANGRLREEIAFILEKEVSRPDSLEQWLAVLSSGGEVETGRRIFFSPISACSTCHTIEGRGGKVGPDLSNIAQSLDREQIIRGTLRPNEQYAPQWQAWIVETTEEETYSGVQADVNGNGSITMFLSSGRWHTIPAREVKEVYASKNSIMPEGLEAGLSIESLRDLMAFLSSLK